MKCCFAVVRTRFYINTTTTELPVLSVPVPSQLCKYYAPRVTTVTMETEYNIRKTKVNLSTCRRVQKKYRRKIVVFKNFIVRGRTCG